MKSFVSASSRDGRRARGRASEVLTSLTRRCMRSTRFDVDANEAGGKHPAGEVPYRETEESVGGVELRLATLLDVSVLAACANEVGGETTLEVGALQRHREQRVGLGECLFQVLPNDYGRGKPQSVRLELVGDGRALDRRQGNSRRTGNGAA